jgi:hypothetical protein
LPSRQKHVPFVAKQLTWFKSPEAQVAFDISQDTSQERDGLTAHAGSRSSKMMFCAFDAIV